MKTLLLPCIALASFTANTFAAPPPTSTTTSTNNIHAAIMDMKITEHYEMAENTQEPDGFKERVKNELNLQLERDATDRFELPAAQLHWQSEFFDGYAANEAWTKSGRDFAIDSVRRTAREVIGASIPREELTSRGLGFIRRLFRIDDTAQSETRYASAAPSAAEFAWIDHDQHYDCGLNPIDGQLFGKVYVGHAGKNSLSGDKPIAILSGRYVIDPTSAGKLEAGITLPLPYSWRLAASGSTDPGRFDHFGDHNCTSWAVRFERVSDQTDGFRLLYVGLQSHDFLIHNGERSNGPMVAAGLTMPWPNGFWKRW